MSLMPYEKRVLQLAADGVPRKVIAQQIGVTDNVLRTYLSRIYSKLGAGDLAHAVAIALRQHLIS